MPSIAKGRHWLQGQQDLGTELDLLRSKVIKDETHIVAPNPSPHNYNIKSGFGMSRDCFTKVFLAHHPTRDITVPGPGAYTNRELLGKESERYTMRQKTRNRELIRGIVAENKRLSVPGPGTYQTYNTLKGDGKYFVSRFRDSGSTALKSTARRWAHENKTLMIVPGPGRYDFSTTITQVGKNFLSRFQSSQSRKFSIAKREFSLDCRKSKRLL